MFGLPDYYIDQNNYQYNFEVRADMKSDGGSSETKMPVHLAESLTAMREAAEKSEQRRIKPNSKQIKKE